MSNACLNLYRLALLMGLLISSAVYGQSLGRHIGFSTLTSGDSSSALQDTIVSLCSDDGGTLELGTGVFHLKASVVVTCPINIVGQGWREAPRNDKKQGTWISIEQDKEPAIVFAHGSKGASLEKVAFIQPNQVVPLPTDHTWHPVSMPPVIMLKNVEGLTFLRDLYMNGVDKGIESWNGGRTSIDGLFGQFFSSGIVLDDEMDMSRIQNVHSWPYFSDNPAVIDYQQHHLDTIVLGRVDGAFIDNIFAFAAKSGIRFEETRSKGIATGIQIGKLECDSVQHCIRVETNGTTMMVGEMRQFGQEGISSGHPLADADAISITGQASVLASQIEARMIDHAFVDINNPQQCSNVRIGNAFIDFTKSRDSNPVAVRNEPCGSHGETNEVLFGTRPALLGKH